MDQFHKTLFVAPIKLQNKCVGKRVCALGGIKKKVFCHMKAVENINPLQNNGQSNVKGKLPSRSQ